MPPQVNLKGALQILPFLNWVHSAEAKEGPRQTAAAAAKSKLVKCMVETWLKRLYQK